MSTVFKIKNGNAWHDYSDMVKLSGVSWTRNTLDAPGAGRTLDGVMHRAFVANKRTLEYQLMPDRLDRYAALDTDLDQQEFELQFTDLHGISTKTFYCSSFKATMDMDVDDDPEWSGGGFTVIEV